MNLCVQLYLKTIRFDLDTHEYLNRKFQNMH